MALKIVKGGEALAPAETKHPQVVPAQLEVFGRLRMTPSQIASYYGLTIHQIRGLLRRADLKEAYERGRAETVVAIRQTQLRVALGTTSEDGKTVIPPNVQMLIHAGYMFGDQTKDGIEDEPEDFNPSRFSWDTEMKERIAKARAEVLGDGAEPGGYE